MNLDMIHNQDNNSDELKVIGEVDAHTAPDLKEKLLALTEKQGNQITLNLSQTTYMDSTGIGVIIAAYKSSKIHDVTITIRGITPRVKRLFDMTGLSDFVMIEQVKEDI